jgi:hypothetical protein
MLLYSIGGFLFGRIARRSMNGSENINSSPKLAQGNKKSVGINLKAYTILLKAYLRNHPEGLEIKKQSEETNDG